MLEEYRIESTSIGQYLVSVNEDEDIKVAQAVQREFCWNKEMMNSLIYSALSCKIYIPNIVLAEEKKENGTKQTYVVDGGQRTETLRQFRYGGYRITNALRTYLVTYKKKKVDEKGVIIRDKYGNVEWELDEFDIRKKTYEDLPDDLKKRFNECPIAKAIYQDCTPEETSEMVLLYNNHAGMNVSQKALTYLGKYADEIRRIRDSNRFLLDGTALTEAEKKKGIWERVISECVMAVNHFDVWKKQPQKMCDYLNRNSSEEEFKKIENYFDRLAPYVDKLENKELSDLFVSKDFCVWMMLFDKFDKLHLPDERFVDFLNIFVFELKYKKMEGENWPVLMTDKHTKDKSVLSRKIKYLEVLMMQYFHL